MKNSVEISGKIKKASLKYTDKGVAVCNASLSTMYKRKGQEEPVFSYFPVVAWKEIAENLSNAEDKLVEIKGMLKQDQWTNDEGKKMSKVSILINEFSVLESAQKENTKPTPTSKPKYEKKPETKPEPSEDAPF